MTYFILTIMITMNGQPYVTMRSLAPSYADCVETGQKAEKKFPEISEGKGKVEWSCKPQMMKKAVRGSAKFNEI